MRAPSYLVVPAVEFRPWWAQRLAAREALRNRQVLGAAARQGGKSVFGAYVLVRRAAARPNGASLLLVPTYRIGLQIKMWVDRFVARLGAEWNHEQGRWTLPNGHVIWYRSTERPDATRGLTINTTLLEDEAALITKTADSAALGCCGTADSDFLLLRITTPRGKGQWLYQEWTAEKPNGRFHFRSSDSPYTNAEMLKLIQGSMTSAMTAQELLALFVDGATMPFTPEMIEALLSPTPLRIRGEQLVLGVDLAKRRDYTVCTLMNEFGEAWILGRWRHVEWPDTEARIIEMARQHNALVCVDLGGFAGTMADYLERALGKPRVLAVNTASGGVKASICESLVADCEHGRLKLDGREHTADARHELQFFEQTSTVVQGVERIRFQGPQDDSGDDEVSAHDDIVLSLALANWGRIEGLKQVRTRDFTALARTTRALGSADAGPKRGQRLPGKMPWEGGLG